MPDMFQRTELLLGKSALQKLKNSYIAIFGLGGVGGYVAEALIRSGVGKMDIIDNDTINATNLNRQIIALNSTLGQYKTDTLKAHAYDINPEIIINAHRVFFSEENSSEFDFSKYDYVVDAIDSVKSKLALIECAKKADTKIISSMGTGNKLDPTKLEITDISKTSVCPLARIIRTQLRKRGITSLKVVYSKEQPRKNDSNIVSSYACTPAAAGLIIASEIIKDLSLDE